MLLVNELKLCGKHRDTKAQRQKETLRIFIFVPLCLCVSVFHTTVEFTPMFYDPCASTIAPVTTTLTRLSGSINFHPQDIN
jgi:hypothetical protein